MKKLSFTSLLAAFVLMFAMSTSTLSAQMKCGAGKCGASVEKKACCNATAGELKAPDCKICKAADCKCESAVKCTCKDTSKCTCDADKKAPKAAMKCGTGKCG